MGWGWHCRWQNETRRSPKDPHFHKFQHLTMSLNHAEQQRVTDSCQIVGIVSEASALEMNRKQFLFVGPHSASS